MDKKSFIETFHNSNPWRFAVIIMLAVMAGMYMGQAQTGQQLKELKTAVITQAPTTVPKAPGQ